MVTTIHAPMGIAATDKHLFVLESNSSRLGDENIVRVDLTSGNSERVFTEVRAGIMKMIALPEAKQIAANEYLKNQVLIIDEDSNKLSHSLSVPAGTPLALATYGKCLAVLSDESRHVTFFDTTTYTQVNEWDLSTVGTRFKQGHELTVDSATAAKLNVFVRLRNNLS